MSRPQRPERPTYQRSGRVAWLRFLPLAALTLVVAAGMGYVWALAFAAGWHYWVATPLVLALPVTGAAFAAVAGGRCRNRTVAGALGVLAVLVVQAGYFHFDMVRLFGPGVRWRFDLLPEFIALRMATDGAGFVNQEWFNWFRVAVELLLLGGIVVGTAVFRARSAYCEACGRWMRAVTQGADRGIAYDVAYALDEGTWVDVPEVIEARPALSPVGAWLELEYCPNARQPGKACPAYLTLREKRGGTAQPDTVLDQGRISADELAPLADRIAVLSWLRVSAPAAADAPARSRPIDRHAGPVAAVERLPDEAGGADLDRVGVVEFLLGLGTVIAALAGIGLVVWGAVREPWADPTPAAAVGYALLASGLVLALAAGTVCYVNVDYPGMRYALGRVRRWLGQRPDALVPADDPAARFVDVVPRFQWHQTIPDKAADRGLLALDRAGRRLLFEGLKERYVIPAAAVVDCRVEAMLPHTGRWNFYAVVLTVRYPEDAMPSVTGGRRGDEWEVPLLPRPTRFRRYNSAYRRALAEGLRAEIEEVTSNK